MVAAGCGDDEGDDDIATSADVGAGASGDTKDDDVDSSGAEETQGYSGPACTTDLSGQLERLRVPGLAVGVIGDGGINCVGVAGMANIENDRAVDPDTVFTWASVSKAITGTAVMVLVDDGLLALDDDVAEHLPFSPRNPNCPGEAITVRHLLAHASSIVDNDDLYFSLYTDGDSPIELGDFVAGYLDPGGEYYDAGTNFADGCPGQVSEYSNVAVGLLGEIVQHESGMSFDEFCQQRIFAPLGMVDTSFHLNELDLDAVAMPYDGYTPETFEAHGHFGFPTYPDGLLRTSVPHLARFLAMTAGLGAYDNRRILSEQSAAEMRRVQYPELDDTQGLMWYWDFDSMVGHNGGDPGTSSLMFFDPETGKGALLVANGDWYDDDDEAPEARALLQALIADE